MKPYQEFAFLTTPGGGATSVTGHEPIHRAAPPPPASRRGGFAPPRPQEDARPCGGAEGLRGSRSGHRKRQHAHGPHHHTGDRDSHCLLPHGFHPLFGSMLDGTLDQHDPARSDGRHRGILFRRLQKKRKNRPGKGTGAPAVSIRRRGRRGRRNPASPAASSATTFVRRAECLLRVHKWT